MNCILISLLCSSGNDFCFVCIGIIIASCIFCFMYAGSSGLDKILHRVNSSIELMDAFDMSFPFELNNKCVISNIIFSDTILSCFKLLFLMINTLDKINIDKVNKTKINAEIGFRFNKQRKVYKGVCCFNVIGLDANTHSISLRRASTEQ